MEELNKRSRIQNAAVALFSEQGVEATSVNDIVRRANVAKGTFYIYYKDKKELISQIHTRHLWKPRIVIDFIGLHDLAS